MTVWRKLVLLNSTMLALGFILLIASPFTISAPIKMVELVQISIAGVIFLCINGYAVWFLLRPLTLVREALEDVNLTSPIKVQVVGDDDVAHVAGAFNAMVDRVVEQRRNSASLALQAQENERIRISRELHDQIGQILTATLLHVKRLHTKASPEIIDDVELIQETVRLALNEVRAVAGRLRPGVLEDLGLQPALTELCTKLAHDADLSITRRFDDVPPASFEQELVLYRVAQESLTNVIRHAKATQVVVTLRYRDEAYSLEVVDNGHGEHSNHEGSGVHGMRERATLVGGTLSLVGVPGKGTTVRLTVPSEIAGPNDTLTHTMLHEPAVTTP